MRIYCVAILIVAAVSLAILGPSYLQLFRLVQDSSQATGTVTDVRPFDHQQFDWTFAINGHKYTGTDVASHDGSPAVTDLAAGQRVSVSFDPANPANACVCDPFQQARHAIVGAVLAVIFGAGLLTGVVTLFLRLTSQAPRGDPGKPAT